MKILTIDIGTGTQDIFLYDSRLHLENGFKMVVPSPTMLVHRRVKAATRAGAPILLSGVMMGGGPSAWAVQDHLRAGLKVYATPAAAQTLDDELDKVRALGVEIVSDDEAAALPDAVQRIELRDLDLPAIHEAFSRLGIELSDLAAVAVAVFDHGAAPAGVSDRQFRFDYLDQRIRACNSLATFAFRPEDIPPIMTRLQAVAQSAGNLPCPLVVMDTAPAAVLGALFDPKVATRKQKLVCNVGNFHTLAFRLGKQGKVPGMGIEGLFEHHTGEIDLPKLERLLCKLADGSLQHAEVFDDMGHGALMYSDEPFTLGTDEYDVVVTGPRRSMFSLSPALSQREKGILRPYFAAPFGDMMIAGCFGLLAAAAEILPEITEAVTASMREAGAGHPPWEDGLS
ncbi:MAG: DUF1786 domain-containing protein [Anaerolineales bacterium]